MTGRLDGRAAIVTGASRGLGREIALALAAEGLPSRWSGAPKRYGTKGFPGTIGETVAEIEAAGGRALPIRADLLDRDDIARLVGEARDALGPITILVNNAAFTAPAGRRSRVTRRGPRRLGRPWAAREQTSRRYSVRRSARTGGISRSRCSAPMS